MIQLPYVNDLKLILHDELLKTFTGNPQPDYYRIMAYETVRAELKRLNSIAAVFYGLCVVHNNDLLSRAFNEKEMLSPEGNDYFNDTITSIEDEIKSERYDKELYYQIMLINKDLSVFTKINESFRLMYEKRAKTISDDQQSVFLEKYNLLLQSCEYLELLIENYFARILRLDDKSIVEMMNKVIEGEIE
jgi:hypothetical protein